MGVMVRVLPEDGAVLIPEIPGVLPSTQAAYRFCFCVLNSSACLNFLSYLWKAAAAPDNERSGVQPPASVGALQPAAQWQTTACTATQFSDKSKAVIKRRVTQRISDPSCRTASVSI